MHAESDQARSFYEHLIPEFERSPTDPLRLLLLPKDIRPWRSAPPAVPGIRHAEALAASQSFLSPIGYQTSLMVFAPGFAVWH